MRREEGERLQKVLAHLGVASRRGVEALIREGRITVDGDPARLGMRVTSTEGVLVDGRPVSKPGERLTLMLHKPRGVITTASDERGRRTVMELVPEIAGLHPVGRLDKDSEGLLLLSNDGELTLRLTHPRYGHSKTYRVWCAEGTLPPKQLDRLVGGVELEDGFARAGDARRMPGGCELVLGEGRKRQVRRMMAAVGCSVNRLVRTRIGSLELGDLAAGDWRALSDDEILAAQEFDS